MIISKDLFIFGEQIFATIIPDTGLTTTTTTTAQTTQQQQQQQQQQKVSNEIAKIIKTDAEIKEEAAIAADYQNEFNESSTAAATNIVELQQQMVVESKELLIAQNIKQEKLNIKLATTATKAQQAVAEEEDEEEEEEEAANDSLEEKPLMLNKHTINIVATKQTLPTTATIVAAALNAQTTAIVEKPQKDFHLQIEAIESDTQALLYAPKTTPATSVAAAAAATALTAANITKITTTPTAVVAPLQQQLTTAATAAAAATSTSATTTGTAAAAATIIDNSCSKQVNNKTSSSEDISLNMSKIMLANNAARGDQAMATFPFISPAEQQRTLQLTFQNINVLHNERKILSDVSGLVSPGEVLAIMGPSGSGKTTLLDCLSGQRRIDSGSIYLNREPLSKKWRRKICYVLQEEIFFSGLTLRETVMYTALLRLPEKMPKSEKMKLVDRILEALELNFCQETKFGDYLNRGLSGGEKKRANIACELLTNPLLMLLDEPTSGLDSHSAISLMKVLKRYALQEQKTVVITVHQPSSQMFHMFDKLLLLYNGRTAYFGEVDKIYRYFEDIGVAIHPHYNPADFVLEQLKSHPDIREKLFIAAKESHGNFLNRNCITVNTNNQHNLKHHQAINHEQNGITEVIVNDKSHQHDTLINDIINNYYKDMQNKHNNHNNHHHNHNHHDAAALLMLENDHHHQNHNHHHLVNSSASSCEEAAQQLWCGADSQSNFSSASSEQYEGGTAAAGGGGGVGSGNWLDYPTRFHTQFSVLSSRNFKEAKPRMLSKLNWFQTIGLALMAGAIWFQIPRTEEFLHDLQGWMFFSQTYWMLFALFGALNSFPSEREVISKERRSGAYRLSAYYLAKMCGELPLVVTLPTVYLMISYPMLGCTSFKLFFLMLIFLLLNTIVAQSVGFFIGACCMDMNVSITLSALYTLATQLFGGYLSTRIPEGLSWVRYTSMIHYAYQNMQILEFHEGPAIRCGNPSRFAICENNTTQFIPYEEILKAQNSNSPLWLNTLVLMIFFVVFRFLGYAVLRYVRCPKT